MLGGLCLIIALLINQCILFSELQSIIMLTSILDCEPQDDYNSDHIGGGLRAARNWPLRVCMPTGVHSAVPSTMRAVHRTAGSSKDR